MTATVSEASAASRIPRGPSVRSSRLRWNRSWARAATMWACIVICVAPLAVIAIAAVTKSWNRGGPFAGGVTLEWIAQAMPTYLPRLSVSLQIMVITLVLTIVFGIPIAWLLARQKIPGAGALQWFTSLPLSLPGIAMGLALIGSYPQLQSTGLLVIAGHAMLTTPFMVAALVPVLADPAQRDLEQVARTLGASAVRRFMTVTLPFLRTGLLSGALMVSAISLGEFNISYFVISPAQTTLPVGLFSSFIYGTTSEAAAQTVLFCLAVLPVSIVLQVLGKLLLKRSGN